MDCGNASVLKVSGSTNTFETTSNPPGSVRSFSMFGDSACGEPLLTQHLVVDFTPDDEIDTDFVQKKVCAFWEFVDVTPELRDILVLPDASLFKVSESSDCRPEVKKRKKHNFDNRVVTNDCTAVSLLEFVEERGQLDPTFKSPMPQSTCSPSFRKYQENQISMDLEEAKKYERGKNRNLYQCHMKYNKRRHTTDFRRSKINADQYRAWDDLHPKCMQCPRHMHAGAHAHTHGHTRAC